MKFFFTWLCLVFTFTLQAQTKVPPAHGKITGHVIDSLTRLPVDYASIILYRSADPKPVNGITTDQKGNFTLNGIADGEYRLTADFIGYSKATVLQINLTPQNRNVVLNTINLRPGSTQLTTVAVTGKPPIIENKIDKLVYNAANDLTGQGGMATDILKKVPMVTVDIDGNVELQGNASIRFLINGKPSSIFGNSIADALQSIPASQIKSIEVITSPGAKYDASGTGGIINIILKANNIQGINGSINLSAGSRQENGSASLNIKRGTFGIGASMGGNSQLNTLTLNTLNRHSTIGDTVNDLNQQGTSQVHRNGYRTGLNIDWAPDKKNELSASIGQDLSRNSNSNLTNQQIIVQRPAGVLSNSMNLLNATNHTKENGLDLGLEYRKTFDKEDQELDFQVNSGIGNNASSYHQLQEDRNTLVPFAGATSTNPGKDNETEISLDYVQPVNDNLTIETGAKTVINTIASNAAVYALDKSSQQYSFDASQSAALNYKQVVGAAYVSASTRLFDYLDLKTGLRYERTISTANYSQVGAIRLDPYNTFAPSFVVSHTSKHKSTVKFSYSYRIERPDYGDLNPFIDLSDPKNFSSGNPALKPEIGNNFELAFNKSGEQGASLFISAFYRHNGNDVKGFTTFYPSFTIGDSVYHNVTYTTRQNIGEEIREGINVSGSLPAGDKLTFRTNIQFGNQTIINKFTGGPNVNGLGYRLNMNFTAQPASNLTAEFFANYNSSQKNIQGNRPAFFSYNMAFRKQFNGKKASVGLSATNPFNKYTEQMTTVTTGNSSRLSTRQVPYRSFALVLSYRFGKLEFKKEKDDQNNLPAPID